MRIEARSFEEHGETASTSACVRLEELAEWEPLEERSLLLSAPGTRRAHLITLATPIEGLRFASDIEALAGDVDGFICPNGVDAIIVEECFCALASIASIEYVTEKQTAELLGEAPISL